MAKCLSAECAGGSCVKWRRSVRTPLRVCGGILQRVRPRMNPDEYIKLAEVEDRMWYFRSLHRHVLRLLRRGIAQVPDARILDAGCGTGGLLRFLGEAEPAWRLRGIDLSPLACERARRRTTAEVLEASATALPFEDECFDAIVSADVLPQVERPIEIVAELARCTRPGGVVVINAAAYRWLRSYHDEMAQSRHRFRRSEVVAMLKTVGLEPLYASYWNCLPLPFVVVRRKILGRWAGAGDVQMYPAPVELFFNALMGIEHAWMRKNGRLAGGSSVLILARKN